MVWFDNANIVYYYYGTVLYYCILPKQLMYYKREENTHIHTLQNPMKVGFTYLQSMDF